jgi:prophage antirepressor-like protein
MESLNELFFKFSNKTLIVILDKHNKPWFNASHIARILKYKRPNDAIRQLVEREYIKNFKDIVNNYKSYHNAQPTSLFINESGIYALLLRSKKKAAIKFYKWTIEDVLPSIRMKGYYELEQKYKIEVDELNQRIKILENNQAIKHITKGKYIYIIKSADNKLIKMRSTEIYKIGKTIKFNPRMNTINTSSKDNLIILYKAKIDDITAVENCLKGMLSKQMYRSNREHYIM